MQIGIPAETIAGETRVAMTPETVKKLKAQGHVLRVQSGAGVAASVTDAAYEAAGAEITDAAGALGCELVLKVRSPSESELAQMKSGSCLVGMLNPFDAQGLGRLAGAGLTSFALEAAPRTTRAQSMDVLSSQANIAGYKAVMMAADKYQRFFPMLMTAAGTIQPAKIVIIGAGVAGLQAIATAKRMGAVVEVSDVRPAVKEQVESLGGRFIELPELESGEGKGGYAKELTPEFLAKQREILTARVHLADVVITTAQVPGKKAPTLLTKEMVEGMKPGGVVVDIAAAQGGNCELTKADEEVVHNGVLILGPSNLAATVPQDASLLYARNLHTLLKLVTTKEGELQLPENDEVVDGTLLCKEGKVTHPMIAPLVG